METQDEKINRLFEAIRALQAENWALKHFVMAMYAQGTDVNNVMQHYMHSCQETETHNTFSTLPEDFVTTFHDVWREVGSSAHHALQRAPELRTRK